MKYHEATKIAVEGALDPPLGTDCNYPNAVRVRRHVPTALSLVCLRCPSKRRLPPITRTPPRKTLRTDWITMDARLDVDRQHHVAWPAFPVKVPEPGAHRARYVSRIGPPSLEVVARGSSATLAPISRVAVECPL